MSLPKNNINIEDVFDQSYIIETVFYFILARLVALSLLDLTHYFFPINSNIRLSSRTFLIKLQSQIRRKERGGIVVSNF